MALEGKAQQKTIRYAKAIGLKVKRNYMGPGAEVGWPDLEIFYPQGRILLIEMKAPGKKPKKIQEHRAKELRELGHTVVSCDTFIQAKDEIDAFGQRLGLWI